MCVIVVKTKESPMPSDIELLNCFENNPDGAGIMYVDKGEVVIEKGFMYWGMLKKRLEELKFIYDDFKDKSLVLHFRIGTQGKNDSHTCHPFPITSKHKLLRKTNLRTDIGMVHNGIIDEFTVHSYSSNGYRYTYSKYKHPKDSLLSDTQLFIRYCVSAFKSLNRNFYKNPQVMQCLDKIADGRLCFLDKNDDVYMLGDYTEHNGVFYSNTSYISRTTTYNYPKNGLWGDWDDYDHEGVKYLEHLEKEEKDNEGDKTPVISPYSYEGYYVTEVMDYLCPLDKGTSFLCNDDSIHTADEDEEYWLDTDINWLYRMDGHGIMHYVGEGEIILEG